MFMGRNVRVRQIYSVLNYEILVSGDLDYLWSKD